MSLLSRLRKQEESGHVASVVVTGAGLIGKGVVRQVDLTPGMRTALIVNRTEASAVQAFISAGHSADDVVVSDDPAVLNEAIRRGRPAVTRRLDVLPELRGLDVLVEVTGAVEYGAIAAVLAIDSGLHVVMMNAETDATVGCALKARADEANVVYTNSDGDQPGVLRRLVDYVEGVGFEIVAAVNCKGFMDIHATPESIAVWAKKQNTSLPMTTAFTDGTKMNIENAVLCNATGLVPDVRGMHGITTSLAAALADCMSVFTRRGVVDYTLGGDFGGGVFVIGYAEDPVMVQPYMRYLKMGEGPEYLFFRPYHLCHLETPLSIAEAVLDGEPTIAPLGRPVVEVVAVAKRHLKAGETLDGIGGFTCYGQIDTLRAAHDLLPIGLTEGVVLNQDVRADEPIPLLAVELDTASTLMKLRHDQSQIARSRIDRAA